VTSETNAILVAKRDGSREPFRPAKLARCLRLALHSCPCDTEQVAEALVEAVADHLRGWPAMEPPTSAYLYHCVGTALRQTGLGEAARRIAVHRRQRVVQRSRLRVFDPGRPERRPEAWRKARIVATLQDRYELSRPVARILAGEIEMHAFALNRRLIAKPLVEELIGDELAAWGLGGEPVSAPARRNRVPSPLPYAEN